MQESANLSDKLIVGEQVVQKIASVAVLVMRRCVICHWNRNGVSVQKIYGCLLAYLTGSCNSRWRLTTILDYFFVDIFVKSHHNKLTFCWFVSCKAFHVVLYFRECSFWNDGNIQDGVRPLSWITVLLIILSNLNIKSWKFAGLFHSKSFV